VGFSTGSEDEDDLLNENEEDYFIPPSPPPPLKREANSDVDSFGPTPEQKPYLFIPPASPPPNSLPLSPPPKSSPLSTPPESFPLLPPPTPLRSNKPPHLSFYDYYWTLELEQRDALMCEFMNLQEILSHMPELSHYNEVSNS